MLEALHPGRIDLGIGRAPGTDPLTAAALRRGPELLGADDFPEQLGELLGYFDGAFPEGHPYARITAVPARGYQPAIWLLGSSTTARTPPAVLGLPFSFAYHFAAGDARRRARGLPQRVPAVRRARRAVRDARRRRASARETDEQARRLAEPGALAFLRLRQGRPDVYPTPEEAAEYQLHAARAGAASTTGPRRTSSATRTPCGPGSRRWSSAPAPTS